MTPPIFPVKSVLFNATLLAPRQRRSALEHAATEPKLVALQRQTDGPLHFIALPCARDIARKVSRIRLCNLSDFARLLPIANAGRGDPHNAHRSFGVIHVLGCLAIGGACPIATKILWNLNRSSVGNTCHDAERDCTHHFFHNPPRETRFDYLFHSIALCCGLVGESV